MFTVYDVKCNSFGVECWENVERGREKCNMHAKFMVQGGKGLNLQLGEKKQKKKKSDITFVEK